MRNALRNRPDDFKRRVVQRVYTNKTELLEVEHRWLQLIDDNEMKVKYYNMSKRHFGHWSSTPDARTIAKKSGDARKGKSLGPCSDETRSKISAAKKGKLLTEEHKQALKEARAGFTLSETHKQAISNSHPSKKEGYIHYSKRPGFAPKAKKTGSCVTCGLPTPSRRAKFCKDHFTTKPK
jgi:hypothetical protein